LLKYWYGPRARKLGQMARREQGACARRQWETAQNFPINDFSGSKIDASVAELEEEKSLVGDLIGN